MKKKMYLVLDTETATLPFVKEMNEDTKKSVAIAKPLVYDIGWAMIDRQGNEYLRRNYLVQETFFVPSVFNTAYYREKRPIYMEMLARGEIEVKNWDEIAAILLDDMSKCDFVCAYNAAFDFKKAIPFTEKYIKALYSADYNDWERRQKWHCDQIAKGKRKSGANPKYLKPEFEFRGKTFSIVDLWAVACDESYKLININRYRKFCLNNNLWSASCLYFKTSAETSFQYLMGQHDFVESHTALDDSLIEAKILVKALKKRGVQPVMGNFPFRELGTTVEFCRENRVPTENLRALRDSMEEYANTIKNARYAAQIEGYCSTLNYLLDKA